jgi:hypothetical protein
LLIFLHALARLGDEELYAVAAPKSPPQRRGKVENVQVIMDND